MFAFDCRSAVVVPHVLRRCLVSRLTLCFPVLCSSLILLDTRQRPVTSFLSLHTFSCCSKQCCPWMKTTSATLRLSVSAALNNGSAFSGISHSSRSLFHAMLHHILRLSVLSFSFLVPIFTSFYPSATHCLLEAGKDRENRQKCLLFLLLAFVRRWLLI